MKPPQKHLPHSEAVYVSPSLEIYIGRRPKTGEAELTPAVYAYLHHQTTIAQQAALDGSITTITWEIIRNRFNTIHNHALRTFGQDVLDKALSLYARMPDIEREKYSPFQNARTEQNFQNAPASAPPLGHTATHAETPHAAGVSPLTTAAGITSLLANWDTFVSDFLSWNTEIEIKSLRLGPIWLVPKLTADPTETANSKNRHRRRRELTPPGLRLLLEMIDAFGPDAVCVNFDHA